MARKTKSLKPAKVQAPKSISEALSGAPMSFELRATKSLASAVVESKAGHCSLALKNLIDGAKLAPENGVFARRVKVTMRAFESHCAPGAKAKT